MGAGAGAQARDRLSWVAHRNRDTGEQRNAERDGQEDTWVESLHLQDVPSPAIARGHVRVRVKVAGIGFVEALKIAGRYQTKDPLPFVPGMGVRRNCQRARR